MDDENADLVAELLVIMNAGYDPVEALRQSQDAIDHHSDEDDD